MNRQFDEALKRMKMLKLSPQCIKAFKNGKVWLSEGIGYLYEVNDQEQKMVDEFEKKHNAKVYHVIHNRTQFGELYSILFVSQYEEEWEMDVEDIKQNIVFVYVLNKTYDDFSEFGSIMIRPNIGGLIRTT